MTPGEQFRKDFLEAYEVDDPGGLALLDQATAVLDRIADLEAVVAADGLMTAGSTGQTRTHPALDAIRRERDSFARILRDLEPPKPASGKAGRDLAMKRWRRTV